MSCAYTRKVRGSSAERTEYMPVTVPNTCKHHNWKVIVSRRRVALADSGGRNHNSKTNRLNSLSEVEMLASKPVLNWVCAKLLRLLL